MSGQLDSISFSCAIFLLLLGSHLLVRVLRDKKSQRRQKLWRLGVAAAIMITALQVPGKTALVVQSLNRRMAVTDENPADEALKIVPNPRHHRN